MTTRTEWRVGDRGRDRDGHEVVFLEAYRWGDTTRARFASKSLNDDGKWWLCYGVMGSDGTIPGVEGPIRDEASEPAPSGTAVDLKESTGDWLAFNRALNGRSGPGQQAIARAGLDLITLLLRKNSDYGSAVFKDPVLSPGTTRAEALRCRLSDKLERIIMLTGKDAEVVGESLEDSLDDFAGYRVLEKALKYLEEVSDG